MELFHVINRGVDGRDLFADSQDYARFVHDLYEFNDQSPALEFHRASSRTKNVGRRTSYIREQLVALHAWTLMKNHYHLVLSELVEGGLTLFLRKLSGYARYFNDRHERKGTLLQGRTKKILIQTEPHFLYILHYVHLNPLDYLPGAETWRERDKGTITDVPLMLKYLQTYRWSSYRDYAGIRNFPSVISKEPFDLSPREYTASLRAYLSDRTGDFGTSVFEYD